MPENDALNTVGPGAGHNRPPARVLECTPADDVGGIMNESYEALIERVAEIVEASKRAPSKIEDDDEDKLMTTYTGQISRCMSDIEKARSTEKEAYLKTGNEIQAYFKKLDGAIRPIRDAIDALQKVFKRKKADEERRVREAEARAALAEAERLEREARASEAEVAETLADQAKVAEQLEAAEEARKSAEKADRAAKASDAQLSRTRGEHGTQTALRQREEMTVTDAGRIDWETLGRYVDNDCRDKAIRAFRAAGGSKLRGVEWEMKDAVR